MYTKTDTSTISIINKMRNKILKITGITLILILLCYLLLSNIGIEIGQDFRVGKQVDLQKTQKFSIERSDFYKNYYTNDSLVVLNFWATWCSPCLEEMPNLNKIKSNFKDKPVKFISLSIDKDSVKLNDFLKTDKLQFKDITLENLEYIRAISNLLEDRKLEKHNLINSIPKTYVFKNETILYKVSGQIDKEKLTEQIKINL